MTEEAQYQQRKTAMHMLRSGIRVDAVAQQLGRSVSWVYKWQNRFKAAGWAGLHSRSRAPKHCPRRLAKGGRQNICQARSELEAEAAEQEKLGYIGSRAVRARLAGKGIQPLPSTASIERVVHAVGMTHPHSRSEEPVITYPRLHPTTAGQLCQVDIAPIS